MLIIVCGLPGCGKSSFSRSLSKRISASHVNSDVIRRKLFPEPAYSEEEKESVYAEMAYKAEALLGKGKNVILDATFYNRRYRQVMKDVARRAGEKAFVILCSLSDTEAQKRLENRRSTVSDATFEVYLKVKDAFEPIEGEYLELDSTLPAGKRVKMAMEFLGRG